MFKRARIVPEKVNLLLLLMEAILHQLIGSLSHDLWVWYISGGCLWVQPSTVGMVKFSVSRKQLLANLLCQLRQGKEGMDFLLIDAKQKWYQQRGFWWGVVPLLAGQEIFSDLFVIEKVVEKVVSFCLLHGFSRLCQSFASSGFIDSWGSWIVKTGCTQQVESWKIRCVLCHAAMGGALGQQMNQFDQVFFATSYYRIINAWVFCEKCSGKLMKFRWLCQFLFF